MVQDKYHLSDSWGSARTAVTDQVRKFLQGLSAPLQRSAELGMDSIPEKMLMTLVSGASFLAFSHRQDNPGAFTGESHEAAALCKPHPKFSPATGWPRHQGWTYLRPPDRHHWQTDWSRDPCPHLHLHFQTNPRLKAKKGWVVGHMAWEKQKHLHN